MTNLTPSQVIRSIDQKCIVGLITRDEAIYAQTRVMDIQLSTRSYKQKLRLINKWA